MQNSISTPDQVKDKLLLVIIIILLLGFLFLCFFATLLGLVGNIKHKDSWKNSYFPEEMIEPTTSPVVTPELTIVQNPAEGITSFFVLSEDNPQSFYLNAEFPHGSMIEYVSENAINGKVLIKHQSREILSFLLPHIAISERIETYSNITDSKQESLYRIVLQNGKEYYSNKVNLTEACTEPEILNPPCALPTVYLESLDGFSHLEIEFIGDTGDREVADSIMKTLTSTTASIPVEGLARFYLEPFYGILTERTHYQADFPNGTTIEYVPGGVWGMSRVNTVIKYQSKTLITFSMPYEWYPAPVESYTEIEDSKLENLYRITIYGGGGYSTNLKLDEPCVSVETYNPPCGMPIIDGVVELSETATPEEIEIADSIMRTLAIVP